MNLTSEQQNIIKEIKKDKCSLLKLSSFAGTGKTTMLVQIAKELKPASAIYLAFNKAVSAEASRKFPPSVKCMTIHSLAYRNTVKQYGFSIGFFNVRDIKEWIPYEFKLIMIDIMNEFFSSKYIKFDEFVEYRAKEKYINITENHFAIIKKTIQNMFSGSINITHAGYLKFYHMLLLTNKADNQGLDLMMLDEVQDSGEVTLEIFSLLKAKKKIIVGDKFQALYSFNHCVNGFDYFQNQGTLLYMTQTFRCETSIAKRIELFAQQYIDSSFKFTGIDYSEPEMKNIETIAYLSKTNTQLISKIIELNRQNIPYNLTRPVTSIFELVLILMHLKPNATIYSPEWKHLQEDVDDWENDKALRKLHSTSLGYISELYSQDVSIKSAMNILNSYSREDILEAKDMSKKYENKTQYKTTVTTYFSFKGGEADEVHIMDDINSAFDDVALKQAQGKEFTQADYELCLGLYVAFSRARKVIHNDRHLPELEEE